MNDQKGKKIKDFDRVISRDPKIAEAYYGRGNACLKKADPQRALADAKEALKLKPEEKRYDDLVYEINTGTKRK